jgi:predicted MFS family arabinose efflux permease
MSNVTAAGKPEGRWDKAYEVKTIVLMGLGFGLVGFDRFVINPLFPIIQKDLGLTYQDLGLISAVIALTWGVASIFAGQIADRLGHKPVIVTTTIVFSILVATTGLASGLGSLLLIRALMGLSEGAFVPASIVTTVEASHPSRIGRNVGIQQTAAPFIGMGLGPVIAVGLLKIVPSWHYIFAIAAIPGFIIAAIVAKVIRHDPPHSKADHTPEKSVGFLHALGNRNVVFNILGMCCYLTGLVVMAAFLPNYLTDHLKLTIDEMGLVLAALGFGSMIGTIAIPAASDKLGRKPVLLVSIFVSLLALIGFSGVGATIWLLFVTVFIFALATAGSIAITIGPLTNASVPPAIAATATGLVVGFGEIVGGAVAPAVTGAMAQSIGITVVPKIALVVTAIAIVIVFFGVREPEPNGTTAAALSR